MPSTAEMQQLPVLTEISVTGVDGGHVTLNLHQKDTTEMLFKTVRVVDPFDQQQKEQL